MLQRAPGLGSGARPAAQQPACAVHAPAAVSRRAAPQRRAQRHQRRGRRRAAGGSGGGGRGDWEPREAGWEEGRPPTALDSTDDDEYLDGADLDLFPEEAQGDPEFVVENVLALVLVGLAALAVGNILLKLLIVCYSLVAAAVRYTAVGLFLAVLLLAVQPGRWWF